MTNEELVKVIQGNGYKDSGQILELWNQNKGLIGKACGKYAGRLEEEDAKQECFIAFMAAVKEYDPEKGAAFSTYLHSRCMWHLGRYAADCGQVVRLPQYRRQAIGNYMQFVRQWYQMKGEQPTIWDLQICLGLSADDIEQLRDDMRLLNIRSIDEPLTDDQEGGTLADLVQDPGADAEAAAMDPLFIQERKRAVWAAVDSLKPKEGEAVRMYYGQGMTQDEIAALSGVSRNMIRQRITKGIRRLRTEPRYKELREFVDLSPVYGRAIRGTGSGTFNRTFTSATEGTALWILEAEERWKREREELDRKLEGYRRDREAYERRKAEREQRKAAGLSGS